jgi:hypothetical protein
MITEDIAKLVVEIENSSNNKELMNELVQLQQKTGAFKDENKRLASAMEILRAQGKQNSDEFKRLKESYDANSKSITENEKRMKTLRQTMNNTNLSANDLRKKAKELQTELNGMTRAADPERFDRLNRELKEMQRQLQQVRAGTNDTGSAMGNLMNVGKKLLPAFGITAGIGLIKQLGSAIFDTFKSVQATGDAWAVTVAGMNAGWDYFKRSLVTADWSNFFSNMNKAIKAGEEYARIMDELGERNRSYRIIESETRQEIAEMNIALKNVNLTNKERITIADKIIAKEDALLTHRKSMAADEFDAITNTVAANTTLDQEKLKSFMREYEQNRTLISQADEYIKKVEELNSYEELGNRDGGMIYLTRKNEIKELTEYIANASESVKTYAEIKQKYDKSTDEELEKMVQAWVNLNNVSTDYYNNIQTAEVRKNRLLNKDNSPQKTNETAHKNEITAAEAHNRELRKIEVEKYEQGTIDKKTFDTTIEILEEQLVKRKLAINIKYGKDTGALEDQLLSRTTKHVEDIAKMTEEQKKAQYETELKISENFYREERKKQADRYMQGEIDREQYNDGLKSLEQLFLQEKLALNLKYGKDTAAIEDQLVAYQIKCYEDLQKALAGIREKENKEKSDHEKQLETEAATIIAELRSQSIRETMNFELEQLEKLHRTGLLSEQQYEQKKLQIKLKAAAQYAQKAAQFAQLGANLVGAMQDAEYSKLEAQKEKELALAGDNAEERQRIEEEYEAKKLEVQKKYADLDMAAKIAQTIAAGALAVIQGFAQLGPIGGAISAVIIGATTAFQIASIIQQRNAIKNMSPSGSGGGASTSQRVVLPGHEEGGYVEAEREQDGKRFRARRRRRRGYVDEPTVLTGEAGPEYVAPTEAVDNPTIRPVLDIIEMARNNGTLSSINLPKLIRTAGYETGGYTGAPAGTTTPDIASPPAVATDSALAGLLAETRDLLREIKNNGVKAPIVITEFEKKQALLTKSRALGSRS